MKTRTLTSVLIKGMLFGIVLGIMHPVRAQLFDKLSRYAKEKVREEAEERAKQKIDKAIEKGFDETEGQIDQMGKPTKNRHAENANAPTPRYAMPDNRANFDDLPDSYTFTWVYVLKINAYRGTSDGPTLTYYLNPDLSAFASIAETGYNDEGNRSIMIRDPKSNLAVMLIDMDGRKMIRKMSRNFNRLQDGPADNAEDYTITRIGTKTILGYRCQGYRLENKDGIVKMYIAENAPVSFNAFGHMPNSPQRIMSKMFPAGKKGLVMEMEYQSKTNNKDKVKTTCIQLKKQTHVIDVSSYK